ncbi:ATP-binding protein [Streptomyces litmocidini]|uniref:ATP-binding protein n=1 Tax=Streptomyces litmocidini TaxID=67318 RepID=UPI00167CFC24|nr:AAA family ATPase [Streptomyces litmocidini]
MWNRDEGHDARFVDLFRDGHALVGRDGELAALRAAVSGHRLVTVTGAAGTGKSRLALAALAPPSDDTARTVVRVRWHDGIPVGRRALTARVARALSGAGLPWGVAGAPGGPGLSWDPAPAEPAAPARPVPADEVLLLLDDVDPVHTECIGLVQTLLMARPAVRVLVTARRPLGLGDERVVRLAPLPVEAAPGRPGASPAAELLVSRARERGWTGEPDPATVTRVCRLLEGVPLALELAAGRLGEWTMEELAAHLETGRCRLSDPDPLLLRHRTLRTSVGAVHALCEPAQRKVWRRLSVFTGPFTEAAAVFVCLGSDLAPHEVPPALATLSATGVLQTLGEAGAVRPPRYRMARAARDFGAERLAAAGERPVTRDRHAVHFRGVAAVAETLWNTGLQRQALQTVQDEHDDLMVLAHRAGDGSVHAETALETMLHLWFWWAVHDHAREGSDHLHGLLPRLPADSPLAARGRWLAAWLSAAWDPRTAHHLLSLAWPAAVLAGDDALLGHIAHAHGTLAWQRQDPVTAARYYRQAADTTPSGAPWGPSPAVSLAALAVVQAHHAPAAAARTARRALAQPDCADDAWATALAHHARAFADHRSGHTGRARHRAGRALADLEARVDAPQAHRALRLLLATLDLAAATAGAPTPRPRPHVPVPRDAAQPPSSAASLAQR